MAQHSCCDGKISWLLLATAFVPAETGCLKPPGEAMTPCGHQDLTRSCHVVASMAHESAMSCAEG